MKRFILLMTLMASFFCNTDLNAQNMEYKNMFPRGEELKSPYFTGRVWLEMVSDRDARFNCPIGNVTFEPGCRNNWHKHPGGQILLCVSGEGYYAERGGDVRKGVPRCVGGEVFADAADVGQLLQVAIHLLIAYNRMCYMFL